MPLRVPATINTIAFYAVGLPAAWAFAFPGGFGVFGLWGGLDLGMATLAAGQIVYVWRAVDWEAAARAAQARTAENESLILR